MKQQLFVGPALQAILAATFLTLNATQVSAQPASPVSPVVKLYDSNHKFSGVSGVAYGGVRYDVKFILGQTCAQVYSGCDADSDFPFHTLQDAFGASSALLGALSRTDFTADPVTYAVGLLTPWGKPYSMTAVNGQVNDYVGGAKATFYANGSEFVVNTPFTVGTLAQSVASRGGSTLYFAEWTQANAVPEPGTWGLVACALGAARAVSRRR